MSNAIWDKRFLDLAEHISTWSKDPSTKVGAVLVNDQKIVVGLGYNGFSRGVEDSEWRLNNRDLPAFAIPCICHDCCKVAIQVGVKEVVGVTPSEVNKERAKRWGESIDIARTMCIEAGVAFRGI